MQRAWRLIMALREWMFTHPCTSHCGNVLLKLIAAIPEVSAMLEEALEINAQFAGPHHQKSLLKKHSPDHNEGVALSVMRPCVPCSGVPSARRPIARECSYPKPPQVAPSRF